MLVYKNDLIRNFIVAITISETKMMIEQNFDIHILILPIKTTC